MLALTQASPAAAQQGCFYDGQPVPHGTRVGSLVCDDGQWVPAGG